jgi:hypothetical protein
MAKRVSFKACKAVMVESAKEILSDAEAEEFISAFEKRIENFRSENKLENVEDKLVSLGEEMIQDLTRIALIQKRNSLLTKRAVNTIKKYAKTYPRPVEGLLAFLEDSRRNIEGAGRGVNSVIEGYKSKYLGELRSRLEGAGLWDDFRKDRLEKEIFQEFYAPGSSGSAKAREIRDIMFALKQDSVGRQNLYGAFIHFLPEHVKRQDYNIHLIKKQFGPERFKSILNTDRFLSPDEYEETFQNWAAFMKPLLNAEETFKDADPIKFLRGAFDGIMSGKHGALEKASGAEINAKFFKAGALAKKISTQRLLHFKDGESAYLAYKAMSGQPLSSGFVNELEHAATNIGLMQMLGPNPEASLDTVINELQHEFSRNGMNREQVEIKESAHKLKTALSFLDRSASIPENPTMHTATASVISLLSQAKLGKIALFALPDKVLIHSVLTRNGVGGLDALMSALRITKPASEAERLRLMMMGAELKSMIGAINSRFTTGAEHGVPGTIFKSQAMFFKMAGIEWLDNLGTSAVIGTLPRHLGMMADKSFDNLIPTLQNVFKQYGITKAEWDAWRTTVYHTDAEGNIRDGRGSGESAWITPDRFGNIADGIIDRMLSERKQAITPSNRTRMRNELEEKFRTWLTAQRDEGVLMPGSKEHRIATWGTKAGTGAGSIARLVMMFKTFPITVYTKIARREMMGNGARTFKEWMQAEKNQNFHTTQLIAMATIAGYLSLTIDDALQGKKPRTFNDDRGEFDTGKGLTLLQDSFLRGGAGGLMADLMLREYDEGYKNILRTVTGPVGNEAIHASALFSQTTRGKAKARDAVDFGRGLIPFANLFYVKPALDHLVMWNINEMLDPGYLRRIERETEKQGQEYWLKPSEAVK